MARRPVVRILTFLALAGATAACGSTGPSVVAGTSATTGAAAASTVRSSAPPGASTSAASAPPASTTVTTHAATTAPDTTAATTSSAPASTAPRTTAPRTTTAFTVPKTTTTVPPRAATQVMLPAGTCTWTGLGTAPIPVDLATAQPEQVLEGGTDLYAAVIWFGAAYRGDIDGDGAADVIVAVICSGGGSGSTTELHAYAHDGTALGTLDYGSQNTTKPPFASLGDREAVTGVDITPQAIAVHYVAHTDADPMCCPSLVVTDVFVHRGATFVLTDRHSAPAPGS